MIETPVLLSTAYFPPVQYYARVIKHNPVYIEKYENFNKQTYRNRCMVFGANGTLPLVVPVVKGRGRKIQVKELRISYEENWQVNHWRTIFSGYNSSPFFEFYQDEIQPFFRKRWKFLFDLNLEIHDLICNLLEIENNTIYTDDFEHVPAETLNLREIISPKVEMKADAGFRPQKYTQVFSDKFGFAPNLSILDLLFNEGPNGYNILCSSVID